MPFSKRSPPDYLLEGCHALVPEIPTPYGYTPSLPAGIIFCVLFLGFTALNLYRSIRYRFSLLRRKWYIRVFLTSDIVSLLVQSAGAGVAIGELGGKGTGSSTGVHISSGHRQSRSNAFVAATAVGVLAVYIRCIYRTVQLAQGFAGYLSVHECYFIGLDAIMIVIAYAGFVFYDAGVLDACATKVSRENTEVIA
ncbi:hypothetical protein MKX07_003752 [Trichoderma sp. CBMAI-0711]|nr:hypothetical protein MKX07_003752 [Trichoderma sp. CBMAI-0711]